MLVIMPLQLEEFIKLQSLCQAGLENDLSSNFLSLHHSIVTCTYQSTVFLHRLVLCHNW